jgi:hypothetical protein
LINTLSKLLENKQNNSSFGEIERRIPNPVVWLNTGQANYPSTQPASSSHHQPQLPRISVLPEVEEFLKPSLKKYHELTKFS